MNAWDVPLCLWVVPAVPWTPSPFESPPPSESLEIRRMARIGPHHSLGVRHPLKPTQPHQTINNNNDNDDDNRFAGTTWT